MKKIEFFRHSIDKTDIKRANTILHSVFLTTGRAVNQFEKDFSQYIGRKYTVGLTSCTAALHLSLLALGIGRGDEVITTPLSFHSCRSTAGFRRR
jgi:UDP-4-amino-4-deoxy-L-arabinose-oxoglutarate aminotransferase